MFSRHRITGLLVSLAFVVGLLGACGPKPEPPQVGEINAEPSNTILVGETASLTIKASGTDLQFEWTVSNGSLSSTTAPSLIYTAPDSPGLDTVTVEVTSKGGSTVRSITFQVVTPPTSISTPTPTLTPTEPPTPTSTATPTFTLTPLPSPTPTIHCTPSITEPIRTVQCPTTGDCIFDVKGCFPDVATNQTVVIFVDPGGGNWWPQNLDYPVEMFNSGEWCGQAQVGEGSQPSGTVFHIIALLMNQNEVPTTKHPYTELPTSITASGRIRLDTTVVDTRCAEEESGATIDGTAVPVSDWQSDCSYREPSSLYGKTVVLTTWGIIIEYVDTSIERARIVPPQVPVPVPEDSSLFAGYQSQDGVEVAYRTANPCAPTPILW